MLPKISRFLSPIACFVAALAWFSPSLLDAQVTSSLVTTRITQPIDENSVVTLKGSVHPLANRANDRGAAPDSMPLDRLTLFFKRSDTQESALKRLISDLHTPGSASYHKWLTPDQFGTQFGPSDQDLATVQSWLSSHGFSVTKVNSGRQSIEFSGSVAQFRDTFHSQIHKYAVNGETHYANATDPKVPSALATIIGGFASLNNFRVRSYARMLGTATYNPSTGKTTPQWTIGGSTPSQQNYPLLPGDYAVQYDLNPLYQAGTNGTGQTIAVVNDSNINIYLVQQFRTLFNVSPASNVPQVIIDGNDPGVDGINNPDGPNGDSTEAYLDVEWSGAVAPNAQIDLVIAADTAVQGGVILALEHAIYGNIAPVVSLSFGSCEFGLGSGNAFLNGLYAQAAAQGQSVLVSTGDSGSAGCDSSNSSYAVKGQAVSGYASTPYNVAVGGTDFYYSSWNQGSSALNTQLGQYWSTTPSNSTPMTSILGVIAEQPWNDSQYGLNILDIFNLTGSTTIAGGGGGASNAAICSTSYDPTTGACTGTLSGYPKPSWQSGTGVPSDGVRDLPDISLFASDGSNLSYYPICYSDGDCQPASSGSLVQFTGVGGTSASTPAFAGIMALVNQKYGRQGQADFVLYPLAAQVPAAFHDVQNGTISVPCAYSATAASNSPDCIAVTTPITIGGVIEGQIGTGTTPEYNATAGYDLATGLGTVDANVLVTNWNKVSFATSNVTLTPSQTSFTHGTSITVNGSVTGSTPTGKVALMTDSTEPIQQGQTTFTLNNGSYSGSVNFLPGGTYNVWAHYGGDSKNAQSDSAKTQITVSPENSSLFFNVFDVGTGIDNTVPITSGTTNIPYGTQLILSGIAYPTTFYNQCIAVSNPPSSCSTITFTAPTGTVTFADNGNTINTAVVNAEGDAEYNAPWAIGSHSVTASYSGDNSYNKSSASAFTFSIAKDTPDISASTSFTTNSGALINGQSTVLTILVENSANTAASTHYGVPFSSPAAAPTGSISISGLPSGVPTSATLQPGVDPSSSSPVGIATITLPSNVAAGSYNVTVSYAGDGNYASTSQGFTIPIQSVTGLTSTTTASISGSISPSTTVTISGTVTGQSGHPAPTGKVLIYSSGFSGGNVSLTAGSGDTSTFSTTVGSRDLLQGSNSITVQYNGDSVYAPSAFTLTNPISNPLSDFSMVPQTTIVPVTAGSSGTDTINVSSVNGFSGTVSFSCTASTVTCSVNSSTTLSGGSTSALTLSISAGSSTPNNSYNVLVTGQDSTSQFIHTLAVTAVVTGSTNTPTFSLAANPATLNVTPGTTTGNTSTISITPANTFTGNVALSYTVTGPSGAASPPTVTFAPASPFSITGTTAVTTVATIATTSSTTAGSYTITMSGTSGTLVETTTLTVMVTTPSFALSNSGGITVTQGMSGTSMISVTPSGGFTGNVNLTCTSSNSSAVSCSLNPATANVTGSSAVTSTLTINASSTSGALDRPFDKLLAVGGGATLALVVFFGIPARRRSWRTMLGVLVFAAIISLGIGCGSSGGSNNGGGSASYTVTVTGTDAATGKITQSTTVNVTVNK
ncbi:MAG: Ig-like domain repeat protein [Silvibacterium sp.]|nr:Ig-like domain repeat protein [Silvibacterium sp.]